MIMEVSSLEIDDPASTLNEKFDESSTVLLAEGMLNELKGKTAHRVMLQSDLFDISAVIDSSNQGMNVREALDDRFNNEEYEIPIFSSYEEASELLSETPEAFVVGVSPPGGVVGEEFLKPVGSAAEDGVDIVSGLQTPISDIEEISELDEKYDFQVHDVRQPPENLSVAHGRENYDADVVTVMGTDCGSGKGSTTYELYQQALEEGIDAGFVATGQTGIMTGADRGTAIDMLTVDHAVGTVEHMVDDAAQEYDLVFVEGQGAIKHPAYIGNTAVLKGSDPDSVVLADDPGREVYKYFDIEKAPIEEEIEAISLLSPRNPDISAISTFSKTPATEESYTNLNIPAANIYNEEGVHKLLKSVEDSIEGDYLD